VSGLNSLRENAGFEKKEALSGFYETAVESKTIPFVFHY
jgi:hypothetical protein